MTGDSANTYNMIDRYFDGVMSKAEAEQFKHQLNIDSGLKEAYDTEVAFRAALVEREMVDLRAELKEDWDSGKTSTQGRGLKFGLGGALGLIIIAGLYLYLDNNTPNDHKSHADAIAVQDQPTLKNTDIAVKNNDNSHKPFKVSETGEKIRDDYKVQNLETDKKKDGAVSSEKKTDAESITEDLNEENTDEVENGTFASQEITEISKTDNSTDKAVAEKQSENHSNFDQEDKMNETENNVSISVTADENESDDESTTDETDWDEFDESDETSSEEINYCVSDYKKSFTFMNEEFWNVPNEIGELYSLSIVSKMHKTILTSDNITDFEWDGNDLSGTPQPAGLYKVIVIYESGERCVYDVTLIK